MVLSCIRQLMCGGAVLAMVSGCAGNYGSLAPAIMEPDARPARNFTSFAASLRCMDGLFADLPARRFLISSSGLPDDTKDIDVGADDMLVNAINQMNRTSQRYVFLDQARISGFGQLEIITTRKKTEQKPEIYIRGSISQLDSGAVENEFGATHRDDNSRGIISGVYGHKRTLSVVSVDLHLVRYPSRHVIPGASVANSMVVEKRGLSGVAAGMIDTVRVGLPISIDRVESSGQAVRNLIELGLIELLGRHSNVPYWECLNLDSTAAREGERRERKHVWSPQEVEEVQQDLARLGYFAGTASGEMDAGTRRAISRFQADERLLPNGTIDFDLVERLQERTAGLAAVEAAPQAATAPQSKPVAAPAVSRPSQTAEPGSSPKCVEGRECEGIYRNLYDFIKDDVEF